MKRYAAIHVKRRFASLFRDERGNVMVLVAASMVFLIGVLGLVIDLGKVYVEKSDLKKEATTAVLSASQELVDYEGTTVEEDKQRVRNIVLDILRSYEDEASLEEDGTGIELELNHYVTVRLREKVPFSFMSLFGFEGVTVHEEASAVIKTLSGLTGVVPLGIDESIELNFGEITTLKVGAGDSDTGNFGALALAGRGDKTFMETLKYGYTEPLSVGDTIQTEPGNMSGTSDVISYRISQCPDADLHERGCPRIVPIVVYAGDLGGRSDLTVKGFAFFYLLEPIDDKTIRGKFIRYVENGTYGGAGADKGAYTTRLVEQVTQ